MLALERRLCWDVWVRREGCVLRVVALEVVGRRGASVKGSWVGRAEGIVVFGYKAGWSFCSVQLLWTGVEGVGVVSRLNEM